MSSRSDLQALLVSVLGSNNVYFQPPKTVEMSYPCIVYHRDYAKTQFADDSPYRFTKRYQVTYIDRDPDSSVPDQLALLPMCTFDRFYTADNLNHDVYKLFF